MFPPRQAAFFGEIAGFVGSLYEFLPVGKPELVIFVARTQPFARRSRKMCASSCNICIIYIISPCDSVKAAVGAAEFYRSDSFT